MAFYTAATHLNLVRTPDVFTNAFALQSCQGSSTSYSASNSADASSSFSSSSSSSSSNPTSPYSYKTSKARTHQHPSNNAMNATSSSSTANTAGSSIRGAADILQNTFALASKPWRTASSSSLATASTSGLKQEAMLTPPMTSTFSSRPMTGGSSAVSSTRAGMDYSSSAGSSTRLTLAPALAYPGPASGAATLPTPTSMVVEEATISENTNAASGSGESHSHHQPQAYHRQTQHQQSQSRQEYHHHSTYPPPSQNHHHQYQQEASSHQQRTTLPPIAHLERHLSHLSPLTPPADLPLPQIQIALPSQSTNISSAQSQVPLATQTRVQVPPSKPSPQGFYPSTSTSIEPSPADPMPVPTSTHQTQQSSEQSQSSLHKHQPQAVQPNAPSYVVDWLDFTRTRSAHFIAEKTCEMICYLWFATPSAGSHGGKSIETPPATPPSEPAVVSNGSDGLFASPASLPAVVPSSGMGSKASTNIAPSTLQLRATPTFVSFMQKLLETTQVSQSVIVLSLHYIYRLKERNQYTPAQPGSEFRIAVAGLMMGNKFLDDNTYTNKTWSEVSGIDLSEINHMEREFLLGVDFNLYVDKATYEAWLNLLKGLVLAKERDCRRFGSGTRSHRHGRTEGREGRADRESRAEREREREREERRRKLYGSTGPASRTYATGNNASAAANGNTKSTSTYRGHTHYRARSTSPTLRMSSSTSAAVLGIPPATVASQTAAVYLPYPPAQQQQPQPAGYGLPPATAPSGYHPPASTTSGSSLAYAYVSQNQAQNQSQAHGSYTSSTSGSTYAPSQPAYQMSSSTLHQQYQQHHTQPHVPAQAPAHVPVSMPAYVYPTATPYASYPSGTSSAYTSPSPAPASLAPVRHAPSAHAHPVMHITTAIPRSGSKRTAEAAFSPTSASFAQDISVPPAKTRSVRLPSGAGISLRIPDVVTTSQGSSASGNSSSPLEGLGSFERMSIGGAASRGASPTREREEREERQREREMQRGRESVPPTTLSSRYSYSNDGKRGAGPQNLYFYTLACSPLKPEPASSVNISSYAQNQDANAEDMQTDSAAPVKEDGAGYGYRKTRLRFHQPVFPSNAPYAYADLNASRGVGVGVSVYNASSASFNPYAAPIPSVSGWPASHQQQPEHLHPNNYHSQSGTRLVAQSASTSPAPLQPSSVSSGPLPHFRDDVWARPPAPAYPMQPQQEQDDSEEEEEEEEGMETEEEEDKQMTYAGPGAYTESPLAVPSQAPPPPHSSVPSSKSSSTSTVMYAARTPPLAPAHHNYHQVEHAAHNAQYDRTSPSARIPSAQFANAGPPGVGVMFYEDGSPLRPLQYVQSHSSAAGSAAVGGPVSSGGYAYQPPATSGGYPSSTHGQQAYQYAYGSGYGYSYGR